MIQYAARPPCPQVSLVHPLHWGSCPHLSVTQPWPRSPLTSMSLMPTDGIDTFLSLSSASPPLTAPSSSCSWWLHVFLPSFYVSACSLLDPVPMWLVYTGGPQGLILGHFLFSLSVFFRGRLILFQWLYFPLSVLVSFYGLYSSTPNFNTKFHGMKT